MQTTLEHAGNTTESPTDAARVKSMLTSFRDGDPGRDKALWKEPPPRKKDTLRGPAGLILGLVAIFLTLVWVGLSTDDNGWMLVGFALMFPGIIAVAALVKIGQAKRAASWTKASGRVTRSELVTQARQNGEVQGPRIEYEYKVGFHTLVGQRVSFAELIAGAQAKEAIARYPGGASVPVFYNAANPSEAVIERDLPAFVHSACGIVAVLTAAILFGAWWYLIR
jgi:hypothetical protein